MALTPTVVGDNVWIPGVTAYQYNPDQLIADSKFMSSQPIVLAAGTLLRGAVLGQQTNASIFPTPGTSNTGNGTIGSTSLGATADVGSYTLVATSPTVFTVKDPEGVALPNATVGTAYTSAEINFTITAGGTAFVAGDSFALNVIPSTGNYVLCVKTASDGSQNPTAILADNADASGGPVATGAYLTGEFNSRALIFDTSWTIHTIRPAMRAFTLIVKSSVSAADPL